MRTCIECRFVSHTERLYDGEMYPQCENPKNFVMERNTGEMGKRFKFCSTHRFGPPVIGDVLAILVGQCGPLGRWWKPRKEGAGSE